MRLCCVVLGYDNLLSNKLSQIGLLWTSGQFPSVSADGQQLMAPERRRTLSDTAPQPPWVQPLSGEYRPGRAAAPPAAARERPVREKHDLLYTRFARDWVRPEQIECHRPVQNLTLIRTSVNLRDKTRKRRRGWGGTIGHFNTCRLWRGVKLWPW